MDGVTAGAVEVLDNGTAKFDLALEIGEFVNGASYFEYCSDLFKKETIVQMAEDFQTILTDLITRPNAAFSGLPAVRAVGKRVEMQVAVSR